MSSYDISPRIPSNRWLRPPPTQRNPATVIKTLLNY
jgi:hypothetical protein